MIPFIQTTLDGLMVGSSYGLLALGFALIFGVMRRLNLSYGPSIMIGAYLGTLLYIKFGAPTYGRGDRRGRRLGDGRNLCRAALFRAARCRRGRRLDGFELRYLDAARAGEPADAAASQLSVPVADRRRDSGRWVHSLVRPDYLIMLAAMLAMSAALTLLLYRTPIRPGLARDRREQPRCKVFPGSTSSAPCSRLLR